MYPVFKKVALVIATATLVTTMAFATSFDHCADSLYNMGLILGDGVSYDLESVPTRAEAAVMLTRLLGAEAEAQADFEAGDIAHPFVDVPDWADAHVAYLYTTGLTTGASDTEFESEAECTTQMYAAFLLRALGYFETDGDFTYETAVDFAQELGVADEINLSGDQFLRDNMMGMTYAALAVPSKDEDRMLLEKLVENGAVDQESASSTLEMFQYYNQLNQLLGGIDPSLPREFTMETEIANMVEDMVISSQCTQVDVAVIPADQAMAWTETSTAYASGDYYVVSVEEESVYEALLREGVVETVVDGVTIQRDGVFADYYDQVFQVDGALVSVTAVEDITYSQEENSYTVIYLPQLVSGSWSATTAEQSFRWSDGYFLEGVTLFTREGQAVDSTVTTILTVHSQGDSVTLP